MHKNGMHVNSNSTFEHHSLNKVKVNYSQTFKFITMILSLTICCPFTEEKYRMKLIICWLYLHQNTSKTLRVSITVQLSFC